MISNILIKKTINLTQKIINILLKNKKTYLSHCKKKSEVKGGGRKPWQQKGTGRARAGSIRSPLWKGGGKSFGPQYFQKKKNFLNFKEKKICIQIILILKFFYFKKTNFYFGKIIIMNIIFKSLKCSFLLYKCYFRYFLKLKKNILIIVANYSSIFYTLMKNNKNIIIVDVTNINITTLLLIKKIYVNDFKRIKRYFYEIISKKI